MLGSGGLDNLLRWHMSSVLHMLIDNGMAVMIASHAEQKEQRQHDRFSLFEETYGIPANHFAFFPCLMSSNVDVDG